VLVGSWQPVSSFTLRAHHAGEIGHRRFHCENASNAFRHTTLEKFENALITGHFVFVFVENSGREITQLS